MFESGSSISPWTPAAVNGVEGEITQPRLRLVLLNKVHGLFAKGLCRVADIVDRFRPLQDGVMRICRGVEVVVHSTEKAEILIKTAFQWMIRRQITEMRFAKPSSRIASRLQTIADGFFFSERPNSVQKLPPVQD